MTDDFVSYTHPGWPGVARSFGNYRVVAFASYRDGRPSYALQEVDASDADAPFWCLVSGSVSRSRSVLLRKCADVEGLASACDGLPDAPFDFAPGLFPGWTGKTYAEKVRAGLRAIYREVYIL